MTLWAQYEPSVPGLQLSLALTDDTLPQVHLMQTNAAALDRVCMAKTSVSQPLCCPPVNRVTELAAVMLLLHPCV